VPRGQLGLAYAIAPDGGTWSFGSVEGHLLIRAEYYAHPIGPELAPCCAMSPSVQSVAPSSKSVLVVDDDPDMLAALFAMLSPKYHVTLAVDGVDGLEKSRELPIPDLIIADIAMPGLDGIALAVAVRATPSMLTVPIIFLSGHMFVASMLSRLGAGPFTYVAKTADPELLARRVHRALGEA